MLVREDYPALERRAREEKEEGSQGGERQQRGAKIREQVPRIDRQRRDFHRSSIERRFGKVKYAEFS